MSIASTRRPAPGRERLVLVDGFAGPGRYAGGERGSPLLMLDAFLSHTARAKISSDLVYVFIEEREDRAERLREELVKLELPRQVSCQVITGAFEAVFGQALDSVTDAGRQLAPTFAFIDPFGYSEAPMSLTGRFLQFARCEALIYMPLPFVARFVGREGQEEALNSLFGGDGWRPAIGMQRQERLDFLHDLFRDQLGREGGVEHVRSFEIPTAKGNGYHLFFTTNHLVGLKRMVEVMWATDPVQGRRFRDSTHASELVLFEPDVDTAPLLRAMRSHFAQREFSIEEAEEFTLLQTTYAPSHIKKRTLAPEERSARLEVTRSARKRRFSYPDGTRMRFV